ncbi:ABC transporter permease [Massilia sp. TS11]|uniref:ABC transporter permease n=1 Tax=Massilia sp. TS11 TaxID=2908003 RepID=UPI001ED9E6FA|nr:ABC transporter permease [Massilia sp. TS11]MCG2584840.1 ABC transporter permease [Massilia sp. TS11]
MFQYYFLLGLRSLRRNPALTALMVLTLAVGVAASVSTLTILHIMSGNPIPHKSERLFSPLIDNGQPEGYAPGDPPQDDQLSFHDASNLLASKMGERRTAIFGVSKPIVPQRTDLNPFGASGIAATADFFSMFDAPFQYGQGWGEAEDKAGADVIVLNRGLSEKLFGSANPVGQKVNLMNQDFVVVGVLDHFLPVPRYYRIIGGPGAFGGEDEFVIPFQSAIRHQARPSGSLSCSGRVQPGYQGLLDSECTWIAFWFEMKSAGARAELQNWLDAYADSQRKLGRMKRAAPNQLFDVMQWMEHLKVAGNDSRLAALLAFGFLLLCLVNAIGLMLAKFSVRAPEVGVRRALGAARADIFRQFLVETAVVGLAGGLLGLALAFGALALIGQASRELAVVARMDWQMLILTFVMAIAAAMLAGLLPTWRACQVTPALQLKSQ